MTVIQWRRALTRDVAFVGALSLVSLAAFRVAPAQTDMAQATPAPAPPETAPPAASRPDMPAPSAAPRTDVPQEASPPRAGEICLACGRPVGAGDAAFLYRGRRIVLHRAGCLDVWTSNPDHLFAKEQPRGALFQEPEPHAARILSGWLLFGLYVVLGLVAGAACAYGAVTRGLPPFRWFLAGLVLNIAAIAMLVVRRRRDLSQLPGGVPRGLAKVPLTRPPQHCPVCGALNHPSAPHCLTCGARLAPTVASELRSS